MSPDIIYTRIGSYSYLDAVSNNSELNEYAR